VHLPTQAGCTLACQFCSTGRQGFNRNLSVSEIIGQLWLANRELGADARRRAPVISNVVLMGMGEPLLNFGQHRRGAQADDRRGRVRAFATPRGRCPRPASCR